jgi:NADH:ubiquinone oxidoreductase subunit F (NADH-binding)
VLLDTLESIGLTGHGGGHFPVATKWRAQLQAGGGGVVVANAAEGEPASAKDSALLQFRPHLVLDGLACAAQVVGAEDVVIWLHEGSHRSHRAVSRALAERRAAELAEPTMRVVMGPDRYLSGESSAIIRSLSGGPALPQFRRVRGATSGVHGPPTLVHNVETLARVGRAAGAGRYGYEHTTLLSVAHDDVRTVVEVDPAAALDEVVGAVTGLTRNQLPQAVLVGGYGGAWCSWDRLVGVSADENSVREEGLSLGAGVLIPVAADECGLSQASLIANYLAASSARQCGPCLFGLRSVADLLAELVDGRSRRRDLTRLSRFLAEITGRGGCSHPDGAVRMISSAVTTFAEDVESHLRRGTCLHPERAPYVRIAEVHQ